MVKSNINVILKKIDDAHEEKLIEVNELKRALDASYTVKQIDLLNKLRVVGGELRILKSIMDAKYVALNKH